MSKNAAKKNLLLTRSRVQHAGMEMGFLDQIHGLLPLFLELFQTKFDTFRAMLSHHPIGLNLAFSTFRNA